MKVEAIYEKEDVQRMYDYIKSRRNPRDFMLFSLGIATGYRISDILSLKREDVLGSVITIDEHKTKDRKDGKNKPPRVVGINSRLRKDLDDYLWRIPQGGFLFPSQKANKDGDYVISTTQAYRILNKYAKELGLDINIGCHTLRKTWGYHMYKQYNDIALVMKSFGHSNQEVTLIYIGASKNEIIEKTSNLDFGII